MKARSTENSENKETYWENILSLHNNYKYFYIKKEE